MANFLFFAFLWHVEVQVQRSQKSTIFNHLHQTSLRVNKGFIIRPKQNLFSKDKEGNPEHLAFSGSQLERSIHFTWPYNKKFFLQTRCLITSAGKNGKKSMSLNLEIPLKVGQKLVKIKRLLGSGAFGNVYKVKDKATGMKYALKDVVHQSEESEAEMKEIDILERISHANVVKLIDRDKHSDLDIWHELILMEYCAGGNLNERLNRPSSDIVNVKWMEQAASGLDYLHEKDVVHRDLKTENVLLTQTDDIKLADFGLARPFIALKTKTPSWLCNDSKYYMNSHVGTPHWMAPEVFEGHYTEKADVFSLGAIFFAILQSDCVDVNGKRFYGAFHRVGVSPFSARVQKVGLGCAMAEYGGQNTIQAAFSDGAQGSNTMKNITLAALQKEAKERPTAAEVHRTLEEEMEEVQFWVKEASAYCFTIS